MAALDLERYQAERIDAFSAKARLASTTELEVLVREVTSDSGFLAYPLLLSLLSQPIFTEKLADPRCVRSLDLLRLFAYGTWQDYASNSRSFCAMLPAQELKLKQLTFLTLARSNKKIKKTRLKSLLGFSDSDDALKDFLDSCCNLGIVRGNLKKELECFEGIVRGNLNKELEYFEVLYTVDALQKSRGKVAGKSFAVFLEEEKNDLKGTEAGLLCNGIVKQVSLPQDGSNYCMSELQSRANSLFLSLTRHLIDAHAMGKSFGGQIYAGMFDVIGEQLLLHPEAAAQKQLTPINFTMDRKALASVFRNNTGLNILHQGRDGISKQILYPLYMENLLDHLEGNISNLLEAHHDNPISMARDKNYITFLRCHPTFLKHAVLSVLFWYVRMYYKSSDKVEQKQFVTAIRNIKMRTWYKDVQKHWLFKMVFSAAIYQDTSEDCFRFIRDLEIHVPKYLQERQKFMYRAAIISLLVARHFGNFLPEALYHMLCTYSEKDPKFDLKDWIERLQQLPEEDTTVWTMEWDQLASHGFPNNDLLTHPFHETVLELAKLQENVIDGASASCSLKKWRLLNILRGKSRTMYYKVLINNFEEYASVVHTPTVRTVCQNSSAIFRSPWGVYLSPEDQGHMMSIFHNLLANEVHLIVVTDGSSVSGFDDLGAKGMGIAIGKADLYVAAAGISPHKILPVMIDVGTDSETLLNDPLYHGIHEHRLDEENLCVIIGEFMSAVYTRWPKVIVQFEGFQSKLAFKLLEQYKTMHSVFNDEIQATIGVLIAGLLRAVKAQGKPISDFPQQRIVVAGVDSAGVAILNTLKWTMDRVSQDSEGSFGSIENSRNQIWIVDEHGLFTDNRANADTAKLPFARKKSELPQGLYEGALISNVMNIVKPDIILLLSAVPDLSQEVIQSIKDSSSSRPAIFAMSNCQCTAEQVFTSLGENVMFASSNQFPNVNLGDGNIGYSNHVNNIYLFPGIVLGAILSGSRLISDEILYAAAKCLASLVKDAAAAKGILYPSISSIREITKRVAVAVVRAAVTTFLSEGYGSMNASRLANLSEEETVTYIEEYMWSPT